MPAASVYTQFRALFRKNATLTRRAGKATACDIVIPVVVCMLVLSLRAAVPIDEKPVGMLPCLHVDAVNSVTRH
jgi:hypothetical protein